MVQCSMCGGTGKYLGKKCKQCQGTGDMTLR